MARIARVIVPDHITQRGNRRQKTFFCKWEMKILLSDEKIC